MSASSVMKVNKAFVFVALLAMAMVEVAADGDPFSMTRSDQPEFELMHGQSQSGVNLYHTPAVNGTVKFGLLVPPGGWVGLGWSKDCEMYDADVVIAGVGVPEETPGTFRTLASPAMNIRPEPELAMSIGLTHAWNSTIAFLTVHRRVDGGNVAINGTSMCVIWAYSNVSSPGNHGKDKRGALIIPLTTVGSMGAPQESMAAEESEEPASDATPESGEETAEGGALIAEGSGLSGSSLGSGSAPAASGSAPAAGGSAPMGSGTLQVASGSGPAAGGGPRTIGSATTTRGVSDPAAPSSANGSTKRAANPAVSIGVALIVALLTLSAYLLA